MRFIFYFALWVALNSFEATTESKGLYLDNTDPEVLGGALHDCYRKCIANDIRTCYYDFTIVEWLTMSNQCGNCPYTVEDCYNRGCLTAGGDVRTVSVVNYLLPGPSIQVCKGDIIQVNLTNALGSEGVTIHWHGMSQMDTPYMDGVPFVTQCPILPGNTFLYNFTADPPGTHIWHSHFGFQEADGFHGSLIIREPDDVNEPYYDYDLPEHVMLIWHWWNSPTTPIMKKTVILGSRATTYSLTVNGYAATLKYTKNDEDYYTPRAKFTVRKGYRHRFRTIDNSGAYCPVQVSVDDHKLTIIASDGATIEPVEVDSFIINAGERYDFVLTANQTVKNYWIRYRGLGLCAGGNTPPVSALAILHYEGADDNDPSEPTDYDAANRPGVLLNPVGESVTDYSNNDLIRIADLTNTVSDAPDVSGTPKHTFYIPLGLYKYNNYQAPGFYAQFNEISFKFPPIPLLTQWDQVTTDMYCTPDNNSSQNCHDDYCTCTYIYEVEKDSLVEIFIIDTAGQGDDHPIHFHGHYFQVVAIEAGDISSNISEVKQRNEAGLIKKNTDKAPLKDVIGSPAHGFIAVRMIADNPGFWLIHCHVSAHFEEGMGAVLKVGNYEEMVRAPTNFPTCSGNYDITTSRATSSVKTVVKTKSKG